MQTLHSRAGVAPGYSRVFLISLLSSVSLSAAAIAQSVDRDKPPVEIGPVTVSPSTPRTAPAISPGNQKPRTARRATGRRPTAPIAARPTNPPAGDTTPLNTAAVAGVSSRLGISARETPATVEVISQQTMQDLGIRTTTDVAKAAVGVTGGDAPGAPAIFSMRGFSGDQLNTLYNGIPIGPSTMTGRPMDVAGLQQVEIIKGPDSLVAGLGATGGAVNYVTKAPHTGPIVNEAFTSYDSFNGYRAGYGSGGSTLIDGLDYRFDISHFNDKSFIEDSYSRLSNVSGQLNYRVNDSLKVWGAAEYRQDKDRFYWGTPIVPANGPGIVPTNGIVSGVWSNYYLGGGTPVPPTIDARTLTTSYNVLDNHSGASELWLRSGFQWDITNSISLRSQVYGYDAHRHWFNNEISSFDQTVGNFAGAQSIYRERLALDHAQRLYGNITDLTVNSSIGGMDNRFVATVAASNNQFNVSQDTLFFNDYVDLLNPDRGLYGPRSDEKIYTRVNTASLSFEDRLKLTSTFALIGGIRFEDIKLDRTRFFPDGTLESAKGYPFSTTFNPVTGRVGYTWDITPGVMLYSQYATAADPTVANIFILAPSVPLLLTTSRTYETGVKVLSADKRAEATFSAFDIQRKNVYVPESGIVFNIAGKIESKGIEIAAAINPIAGLKLWGNVAFVQSRFIDFNYVDGNGVFQSYSGKTPPNVPNFIANAGASYRFDTTLPVEIGGLMRHVGDRFNFQDNLLVMNAYTTFDAFAFVDIPKTYFPGVDRTRISFRVRNLTNKLYAAWGDPGYTDQIVLGAPRSYEVAASFRW
ncbi:TonB-dependent receptor [Bradyrhizobium arachidis]|uniref:Ligand-gated channel protein n=1 Tax=Bradyrhizobium arachidis TaxID=858423 RepID=A0AAE7NM51_9BRAD|nr:TonB-dependent receptor [Bradyrhizobium arachidis]QOZ67806.1 ligand-gated channel protein [Bradyrhizobium arachidis]SFV10762.1 iron complex outermembrane recepter protein [Bradyrhizobium arachidis]